MDLLNTWILIIPGLNNSSPEHWQSLWQARYAPSYRVEQQNWDWPERDEWVTAMDHSLELIEAEPVLVAHSLGCITVAHWALENRRPVKGALLVAPVDLERPEFPPGVGGFTPTPMVKLPFPSIVVGSTNDEYCSIGHAEEFARAWGSRFVNAGAYGHINVAAGFGEWPEGEELLKDLIYQELK